MAKCSKCKTYYIGLKCPKCGNPYRVQDNVHVVGFYRDHGKTKSITKSSSVIPKKHCGKYRVKMADYASYRDKIKRMNDDRSVLFERNVLLPLRGRKLGCSLVEARIKGDIILIKKGTKGRVVRETQNAIFIKVGKRTVVVR